jgi:multiple sugar transport system substrate-binding protein
MKRLWICVAVLALVAMACTGGGSSTGSSGPDGSSAPAHVVLWHGYTGVARRTIQQLVSEWNKENPDIQATEQFYGNSSFGLQKVETAIAGGSYPNIAYLYGSWSANIAQSPKVLPLNDLIQGDPNFDWNDFWPAERQAATVNGKIIGVPALVDNLAVMYNKSLFDKAGLAYPTANWTWDDFERDAKAITDPATKVFGWGLPADGTEDTVWHYEAMLWEAGGDITNADNTQATFNSAAGVQALQVIDQMSNVDHSLFNDTTNSKLWDLFNSGKLGLYMTGPWDLPGLTVKYGVVQMPSFPATPDNHQTISGPDNWVLFDHGTAQNEAAFKFMTWFTEGAQDLKNAEANATLPIRASEKALPQYSDLLSKYPGIDTFVANEKNAVKARPVTPEYPKISQALGNAIVSVMLGRSDPKTALDQAAQQSNLILQTGG